MLVNPQAITADVDVEGAVDAAVARLDRRFGSFHRRRLRSAADALAVPLASSPLDLDVPAVLRSLLDGIADDLDAIAIRALITELRGSGRTYRAVAADLGRPGPADALEDRAPELRRLLDLRLARDLAHALDVLADLEADLPLLAKRFGLRAGIVAIETGRGDTHDGGRSVSIVVDADGSRVVHKPAPSDQGRLLHDLARAADPAGSVFGPVVTDAVTVPSPRGARAHAWQRFVRQDDLPDDDAARTWFARYGALVALAAATGATDLHFENVVATLDGPIVVDVETVTSAWTPSPETASAHAALSTRIDRSVLHSMLLPTRFLGSPVAADISGLRSEATAATAMPGYSVVDEGRDTMRFDDADVVIPVAANSVTVRGRHVDPRDHVAALVAGHRRGRRALVAAADRVRHVLVRSVPDEVRQVVRPTFVYARFLEASTHPAYLGSLEDRRDLLGRLPARFRTVRDAAAAALTAVELTAMLDLDVPSFHLRPGSTALHARQHGEDVRVADAVHQDLRATLLAWFEDFLARDGDREEADIVLALAAASDDAWDAPPHADRGGAATPSVPALSLSSDGTGATWLSTVMIGTGLRLAPVALPLFEGGGQLIALAAEAGSAAGALSRADVGRVLHGAVVHAVPPTPEPWHVSPYTGPLSDLVTLAELGSRGWDDPRRTTLPGALLAPLLAGADIAALDHLNGIGGFLRAVRAYGPLVEGIDPAAVAAALDQLVADRSDALAAPAEDGGLAHGVAGRALALADASVIAGGHRPAEDLVRHLLARWDELVVRTAAIRDGRSRSSWCKGAAGTAFAHEQALRALGAGRRQILDALGPELDTLRATPLPDPEEVVDVSFCHGVAGTVAVLRDLGARLDRPDLASAAAGLVSATRGARHRGGLGRAPGITTFFLGSSSWDAVERDLPLPRLLGGVA
jgi:hypothetical protein